MADSTAEFFSAAKFTRRAEASGLTWKELATRLEVHRTTLGAVRNGRSAPSTELLMRMVKVLGGAPVDYLDLPDRQFWSLKLFRTAAGFTQHAVSDALSVAPAAVSGWETGRYKPPRSVLTKLAKFYGAPVVELEAAAGRHGVVTPTEALVLCAQSVVSFAEIACEAAVAMPVGLQRATSVRIREQLEASLETLSAAIRDLPEDEERSKVVDAVRRLAELHKSTKV